MTISTALSRSVFCRKTKILIAAFAVSMSATSAFAQCTGGVTGPGAAAFGPQFNAISTSASSAAGSLAGALGNLSTAFLTQQGSAFVSAPGNPEPNQPGGGVWVRGVGGDVTNKFTSTNSGSLSSPNAAANAVVNTQANLNCAGSVKETFAGVQVGQDISRLNWNGWNFHVGTTAGYLGSQTNDGAGTNTDFEIPFVGGYAVATYGRFFADVMVREEFYNATLNSPAVGLFGQQFGGRGTSVSASAGYNFALPSDWFIEPSGGFIWSRTSIDPFTVSGGLVSQGVVSTLSVSDIDSDIGRLTLRGGRTITSGNMIWQPFASASVFHEFAGNVTASLTSLNASATVPLIISPTGFAPVSLTATNSTTRVGTYGQYSLGLAGQVANTGWLGFVRVDYRNGSNIDGWTGNAGVRYQFTPDMIASVMPVKVKAPPHPYIAPTNWTGFYVGGFGGVDYGKTDMRFVTVPANVANTPPGVGNNPRVMGGLGGFELGYNYQFANNLVVGLEGDIGATNLNGAASCSNNLLPFLDLTCRDSSNWMATLAARFGYSWNRTLFYVKAGGAWEDDRMATSCAFGPLNGVVINVFQIGPCVNGVGAATNGFNSDGTRSGWLIGYGTEFDLGKNWSAKAEYDYIDFGSRTATMSDGVTVMRDSGAISQVKVGVNYRFAPGLVAAKY
jgi:opacity protein-like surface antigen